MEVNIEQHHTFTPGIAAFKEYAIECRKKDSATKFDGLEFQRKIDAFAPALAKHLAEEINTLLSLEKYDVKKIKETFVKSLQDSISTVNKVCCRVLEHIA